MRMQNEADYAIRDIIRSAVDTSRMVADGDESVFTQPEEITNVDNPIMNGGTYAIENYGIHEARLDFNGIAECNACGDVTGECECN